MKKKSLLILLVILILSLSIFLVACNDDPNKNDNKNNTDNNVEQGETKAKEFTVTFNSKEGSGIVSQTIKEGKTIAKPTDPTRKGYEFKGWYKEETFSTLWNFESDKVTKDTTLYAKWEVVYTKVDAKESTVNATGNIEYWKGSNGKYYSDANHQTEITLESTVIAKKSVTSVAKVEAEYGKKGVKAYYKDGDGNKYLKDANGVYNKATDNDLVITDLDGKITLFVNNTMIEEITHKKADTVDLSAKIPGTKGVNYKDVVFYSTNEYIDANKITDLNAYIKNTQNKNIYAVKMYVTTFNANGGTVWPGGPTEHPEDVIFGVNYGVLPDPVWEGHNFIGWFTDPVGGAQIPDSQPYELESDITLYAHWE